MRAGLLTATAPGAIAVIAMQGDPASLASALRSLCGVAQAPPPVGAVALRSLAGVDEGLLVQLREDLAWIMPHGGVRIVERLAEALQALGVAWIASFDESRNLYPEAADPIEAEVLSILAEAASPLAIPLLLDQPRRWRAHEALGDAAGAFTEADRDRWRRLDRLIDPPKVCVVGPPNAGKSTLVNRLAGRDVAIASPVAGTTRDFVSTRLDLAGLVVEWLDLPGFPEIEAKHGPDVLGRHGSIDAAAIALASRTLEQADLVVLLAAPDQAWASTHHPDGTPTLRVMSKSDLPQAATSPRSREADLAISATTGHGVADLVCAVRDALVPAGDLAHRGPWQPRTSPKDAPIRGR
ncbi:MAG: GTPase [Phycisphaerales bacterium]